jgi:hypothetical protein
LNNIEIHYYLLEGSHSMNAFVKNRAEHELLKLITEISSILDIEVEVDLEPIKEGGIKEIIRFLYKKKNALYLDLFKALGTIVIGITIGITTNYIAEDDELERLTKEEKRINIQVLTKQLENRPEKDTVVIINKIINIVNNDYKVRVYKSRFYSQILKENKIYRLSLTKINNDNSYSGEEHSIGRDEFSDQIVNEEDTGVSIIHDAHIEVISPVLKSSNMKWRGSYLGKSISFELKDNDFRNAVLNKTYSFTNGTSIRCTLTYKEGLNDNGEFCWKDINVDDVLEIYEGNITSVTAKHKKIELNKNQTVLELKLK